MEYFILIKTDKKWTHTEIKLENGFSFKQKIQITLYHFNMIRFVLIKKLNKSLKNIIKQYLLYSEDEEDGDANMSTLIPKVETLRNILIEKYAFYLTENEIESFLTKLDKMEIMIGERTNKKSKSM